MRWITGALVSLKHAVTPTIGRGQRYIRVENATFAAVAVCYWRVIDVHELRIVVGRNHATKDVGSAGRRNVGCRPAADSLVLELEIKSADGCVELWSTV